MTKSDRLARRSFLRTGSGLAFGLLARESLAQEITPRAKAKPRPDDRPLAPVACAVIGLGDQGREIVRSLAALPGASIKTLCDSHPASHARALQLAPRAGAAADYRQVLDDRSVQAVWIATPTHQHRELAIAALDAGKHVYCEAPLAHTVDDARAIAQAALRRGTQVFQAGCQRRANPLEQHVSGFVRTGALARLAAGRGHWNKKVSWRRAAASPDREKQLNWRLDKHLSPGLLGEVGLHQIDLASWFLRARPLSLSATGAVMAWKDGREVADTVQCLIEYPNGFRYLYAATLASSFEADRDVFQGSDATVLLHKDRAWMLKESDAPNLGWEVYATKERLHDETGISLVANATKLLDEGKDPSENRDAYTRGPLYYSCEAFLAAVRGQSKIVAGTDAAGGFEATLVALKANEALLTGSKVIFRKEWFALA
jgi:predicted dehydrogenase